MTKLYTALMVIILVIAFGFIVFSPRIETREIITSQETVKTSDLLFNYETVKYPTGVTVYEPNATDRLSVGIVSDKDNLKFGVIPGNGSYVKRYVNLTNREDKAKVFLEAYGDIKPFISFGRNNIIINTDETIMVDVLMNTKGAEFKEYTGEIDVIVQMPKFDFLYNFL